MKLLSYIKNTYKNYIKKLPYVKEVVFELNYHLNIQGFRPGHYYSPIVDTNTLSEKWHAPKKLSGIRLKSEEQLELIDKIKNYIVEFPFSSSPKKEHKYYYDNNFYSYYDAIFLYGLIRLSKPKKIIEIGSGFSSALMLDTNKLHFNNAISLTFIEPNPERLKTLVDVQEITLIQDQVQNTPLNLFSSLKKGDILFIDSSHISKTGSDLNFILFEILPTLNSGVLIHFHDIFFPFEYPTDWVIKEKRNWNENYILKAFLMYNQNFEIKLFNTFIFSEHPHIFKEIKFPTNSKNHTFGSIWITTK